MHISFLSTDRRGPGGFDRDTALIGALEDLGARVSVVEPVKAPAIGFERFRSAVLRRMGYSVSTACDVSRLRRLASAIEKALEGTKADVILSRSTHFTAWLKTPLPTVNWVDAVFDCLVNFYPSFTHLDIWSRWAGHRAERRALQRSSITLLMSFWAASRAIRCYRASESRLGVIQAPAILPIEPSRRDVLAMRMSVRKPLKCLIVGNDWQRKGADIALAAVGKARESGLDIHLTTVGMKAPPLTSEPWLRVLAPLQKGVPSEYLKLSREFCEADVLLLPSRADFSPHVISEAYAFGLPVIGSPVGAVPEMIEFGQTGFVTTRTDDVTEYVQFLRRLATTPGFLPYVAAESRNKYEAEYSLRVAARKMAAHLEVVCSRNDRLQRSS